MHLLVANTAVNSRDEIGQRIVIYSIITFRIVMKEYIRPLYNEFISWGTKKKKFA